MKSDEEIHNLLLTIQSQLNTIDGKVTLVARADRDRILAELERVVKKTPDYAEIYLLLNGKRTQRQVLEELRAAGSTMSEMTISRRFGHMSTELGIAELAPARSAGNVYRKNREMESVLNLSHWMRRWLDDVSKKAGK